MVLREMNMTSDKWFVIEDEGTFSVRNEAMSPRTAFFCYATSSRDLAQARADRINEIGTAAFAAENHRESEAEITAHRTA